MGTDQSVRVDGLPPRAKLVYLVLEQEGQHTQQQLVEKTRLARRTVRRAIADLEEAGILTDRVPAGEVGDTEYVLATPDSTRCCSCD